MGVLVLVVLVGLYAARNLIAREALLGWLRARGVPAEADIGALSLTGLNARIVVGPRARPDLTLEGSQIGYGLNGPWAGRPFGLQVRSVRLIRPVLRARLRRGVLTFGALDPVIAELKKHPSGGPQPTVRVQDGRLILDSDCGVLDIRADAVVDKGRLVRLSGRLAPTALRSGELTTQVRAGAFSLRTHGDRIGLDLDVRLNSFGGRGAGGEGTQARLTGEFPYPDMARRAWVGLVRLRLDAASETAAAGVTRVRALRLTGDFAGRATGWIDSLILTGAGTARATAAGVDAAGMRTRDVNLALDAASLRWTRAGGDRMTGDLKLAATVEKYAQASLRLQAVKAAFAGPIRLASDGFNLSLRGDLAARGAIADLPARDALDVAQVAAVKRLLGGFTLSAPLISATVDKAGLTLLLTQPLLLRDRAGGSVTVAATSGKPVYRNGQGSLGIQIAGGGLPVATADIDAYRFAGAGLVAPMRLKVATDFAPAVGATFETSGELRVAGDTTRFVAGRCATVAAQRLEFGDNDVDQIKGAFCPTSEPMFEYRAGAWSVRGRAQNAAARLVILQTEVSAGSGPVDIRMAHGALSANVDVRTARLRDLSDQTRFNPLQASGPALLRDGVWQAAVVIADPQGRKLGEAQVSHDVRSGAGDINIDSGVLAFTEGGLQPAALSPLAAALGAPVTGSAGFSGEIGWSGDGVTSRGALSIPQLDFTSPAGQVRGLSGEIQFTSLMPVIAPLEQHLRISQVTTFTPLTNVKATLGLAGETLQIREAEAQAGGGRLRVAALDLPFAPGSTGGGVLEVEGVQVDQMVKASPFGDRMDLVARVSGTAPFQMVPQGLRISKGELHAVENGRLSIRREALAGTQAVQPAPAAADAPAPNAFSDFAYQAMENLAFSTLSAEINSLPNGRLGVLFRIKGENRPPTTQELRVGVVDLLNGKFMQKTQPLPSGTKVDLTLDTSLNLDQLLEDVAGYRNARGSAGVQGTGAMPSQGSLEKTR